MSERITPVPASLSLVDFFFDKCSYERKADPIPDNGRINYNFNFDRSITKLDDSNWRVSLQSNVATNNNEVEMHIRVVGLFTVNTDDKKLKNSLISKNTVAILFPYLRSQITLITAQSGLPPVMLPLLNVAGMFQDAPLPGEEN